jgi:cytoskeletal protein RodZ
MNRKVMQLLCVIAALLLLTACRSGGGETTAPSQPLPQQTTVPVLTLPEGEEVEEWDDPIETEPVQTTEPQENTTEPSEDATEPQETPTEPQDDPTEPQVDPTQPPKETDPTEPPQQSTEPPATTQPQVGSRDPADLTYEEYLAMSPSEQQAHYEQFPSLEAYIAWHNAALAEYEKNQESIEVTGGFDIGDFMNP